MNTTLLGLLCLVCVPEPQFIPVPMFVPIPKFEATIRESRIVDPCPGGVCPVDVAPTKRTERTWGITGWVPGACASCPATPQYGWIEQEVETVAEAARRLEGWRGLPDDEVKRLAGIVDRPAFEKSLRQEWSMGTCAMACVAGGSQLFDVFEDGTVKLAVEQPAEAPDEGSHGGGFRIFRRRR